MITSMQIVPLSLSPFHSSLSLEFYSWVSGGDLDIFFEMSRSYLNSKTDSAICTNPHLTSLSWSKALDMLCFSFFHSFSPTSPCPIPAPLGLLLEPVLWPNQGGHTVPKHWSLLCYACNIWEGTLSQLYFVSDSLNVSQLHIFSESEDGSKYPLSPVSQQPVLPKPGHRQCATLLLWRGSVPEGQVGGFFSASASLEMCVKGEGVLWSS